MVKRLSTTWETRLRSLGWEDPLEKEMAIHSRTIAWKIPWTEELGRYSPWGRKELDMTERRHFTSLLSTSTVAGVAEKLQSFQLTRGLPWWSSG